MVRDAGTLFVGSSKTRTSKIQVTRQTYNPIGERTSWQLTPSLQLHSFFQSFIVDGQAEKISGHSYTLADLKANIKAKLFGQALAAGDAQ